MNLRRLIPFLDPSVEQWATEARFLNWITFIWLFIGLAVLYSASFHSGLVESNDGLYYFKRQLLGVLFGLVGFSLAVRLPLKRLLMAAPILFFIVLGLIFATRLPGIGSTVNGATRWIQVGPFPLQPSEIMKPILILQSAQIFARWTRLTVQERSLWLGLFAITLLGILIQPNLSTTALYGIALWLVALAAGLPYWQLGGTAIGGIMVAALSISFADYQRRRVMSFLNPWADPMQDGYQLIQSLLAVGSGGFWGTGFGQSQQKLSYLPFQHTDFIFSIYSEEFGLVGSFFLILMLMVYSLLALRVALKTQHPIYRLIAIGAMVFMVGQSFLHIGVAIGILPTTGLPLPMFSYGSNSMIASLFTAGLLIRVARESQETSIVPLPQRTR
ncbi:MAG: FtsW/RodA/SpoVE family cell cycle protein [Thermosynechococcaceae cyanobacterium]